MKRWTILAAALMIGAAACSDETGTPGLGGNGSTRVYLTDAPWPYDDVAKVEVHVVKIEASASEDTMPGSPGSGWVTIAAPNQAFDLLELQAGTTALVGSADLPAGTYRSIRVTINTTLSKITMADGSISPVTWPVSGELVLNTLVQYALEVPAEGSTIIIDFDVSRAFLPGFSGGFVFSPVIRAVNDAVTGRITGIVRENGAPVANASITAYRGDPTNSYTWWEVTSARTDAQGRYVLPFLPDAPVYHVFASPALGQNTDWAVNVAVTRGQATTVDLNLSLKLPPGQDSTGGTQPPPPPDSGQGAPSGPVAVVSVTPASQTVSVGDSIGVYANLVNAQGQWLSRSVVFSSSDSSVVDFQGVFGQSALLRAKKAGSVTIVAVSEGKSGSATVVVQ